MIKWEQKKNDYNEYDEERQIKLKDKNILEEEIKELEASLSNKNESNTDGQSIFRGNTGEQDVPTSNKHT